ncbi:hypothetical protein [Mesorhizobium sp. ZC-5]|uniref:hypothetical protein n=1 Tax=Mesorhizobium sp. ZC-5 TaxID=2986066 RepID=UPI0021E872A9|nr:hypothetical protein [Mesorhizobium sp. ZC-5]MCV3239167.1 hypothetical protein [Mesorhizobium sp. ZC-5]
MEFLEALEQSGLARAFKTSFFAYPIVNALHILSIGAVLTSVMLMDLYVLGAIRAVAKAPFMALLRRVALIAFCGALVTGFAMFAIKATNYAAMPVFLAKMTLVALAALNFLFFLRLDRQAEMPSKWIRVSAMTSLGLWIGALLCGRFIGFL